MTLNDLLNRLDALDVHLRANGDKLHVEAPAGALTPGLRAALAEHKAAILARLRATSWCIDPDWVPCRIPLSLDKPPSLWLAERGLRIVDGTADGPNGEPTLFVVDSS